MIKNILMILAAAFAAVSCESVVEEKWSSDNEPILVLNAQLRQDSPSHRIFVNCSSGGSSETVKDAEVTVIVNGAEPVKGVPLAYTREFNGYVADYFDGYEVTVSLAPGDKVEVKAEGQSLTASAIIEVPVAGGVITAVDTSMVLVPVGDSDRFNYRTRQYRITVKDSAPDEKNYYMLSFEDIFYKISPSGKRLDSIAREGSFDGYADQLLHPAQTSLLEEILGDDNRYNLFTDDSFAGSSHTLKVMDETWGAYDDVWMKFWDDMEEGSYYSLDRIIKVYTLTFDEYTYLNAILTANNDLGFMTEPVIFAGNVTGGLGFVTALTPDVYTIEFPAEPYAGEPPYNAYRYLNNFE